MKDPYQGRFHYSIGSARPGVSKTVWKAPKYGIVRQVYSAMMRKLGK